MLRIDNNPEVELLDLPRLSKFQVQLSIKREDKIHSSISGNKWRKLYYNLIEAKKKNFKGILTFGGAFSNHIYAAAAAAKELDLKSIGIIRGEEADENNPTLQFAKSQGMELCKVSRTEYKRKDEKEYLKELSARFPAFYIIPEGGSNQLAVTGASEMVSNDLVDLYDYWAVAIGTGGTAAGIINGLKGKSHVLGFSSLKGGAFLEKDIQSFLTGTYRNWEIRTDYHFGGYAKHQPELIACINNFKAATGIQLDPIYTGKMVYGVLDLIKKGNIPSGAKVLMVHTGGLQGLEGFRARYGKIL